jgi:siroheme synthase (precorrin-2 oxidase/ferrochelatase)
LASPRSAGVTGRVLEVGGGTITAITGWQRAETIVQENDTVTVIGERVRDALARLPAPVPPWSPT